MRIQHIHAENYKTYLNLDLDISVTKDRSIILIGGANGGGKTTIFEAIYGSLYGLNIKDEQEFRELFNAGVRDYQGKSIVLEISFEGPVLHTTQQYKLRRVYKVIDHRPVESVRLAFGPTTFSYGTATPPRVRAEQEAAVAKVIDGNLPKELSTYFLFDAMKTSDLVKERAINELIQNNINKVMGFGKYVLLRKAAEKLLSDEKAKRLEDDKQEREFKQLTKMKEVAESELQQLKDDYDKHLQYSNNNKDLYDQQKKGEDNDELARSKMESVRKQLGNMEKSEIDYRTRLNNTVKNLETDVVIPKLASVIVHEIEQILNAKDNIEKQRKGVLTAQQIDYVARKAADIIRRDYAVNGMIDIGKIVDEIVFSQSDPASLGDKFSYLNHNDVDTLKEMMNQSGNPMLLMDESKRNIDMEVEDEPKLMEDLAFYEEQISGNDYDLIKAYEQNEKTLYDLKEQVAQKKKEIDKLERKLQTFDYQVNQIPDPRYELLCRLPKFFGELYSNLLKKKKDAIERLMCQYLNRDLVAYKDTIAKVTLSQNPDDDEIRFKIFHKAGNEIYLNQLNTGSKQMVMQVLLKVLYELGDYDPPIMIDTVMGVLDKASRETVFRDYFPDLAEQTILLSTDTEITAEDDFAKLQRYVAKAYTLHRDRMNQCTTISEDYFGLKPNND